MGGGEWTGFQGARSKPNQEMSWGASNVFPSGFLKFCGSRSSVLTFPLAWLSFTFEPFLRKPSENNIPHFACSELFEYKCLGSVCFFLPFEALLAQDMDKGSRPSPINSI